MRRCDTCEFWELGGEHTPESQFEKHVDDREGYCRRHAPAPFNFDFANEVLKHLTHLSWQACTEEEQKTEFKDWETAGLGARAWPVTCAHDWCGEWKPSRDASAQ